MLATARQDQAGQSGASDGAGYGSQFASDFTTGVGRTLARDQGRGGASRANKVPGGKLILTSKRSVNEPTEVDLIYRLKYRTKEGDRQTSGTYLVTLFP
jgi:hypothetical protein